MYFERDRAVEILRREPESISADAPRFLARALVIPSTNPEDRMRHDYEVERIAVRVARAREELVGRQVRDVSIPTAAVAAGLEEWPGFDLLSRGKQAGDQYAIEVKGRAAVGAVEVSDNEWAKACNLRGNYWLYVVFNCASDRPELHRCKTRRKTDCPLTPAGSLSTLLRFCNPPNRKSHVRRLGACENPLSPKATA